MVMIFSTTRIEGLEGTYATPALAIEADVRNATLIYTDNEKIIKMAKEFDIDVLPFPKEGSIPKNDKAMKEKEPEKEVIDDNVLTPLVTEPLKDEAVLTATSIPEVKEKKKRTARKTKDK